jgi:hypothetical protein
LVSVSGWVWVCVLVSVSGWVWVWVSVLVSVLVTYWFTIMLFYSQGMLAMVEPYAVTSTFTTSQEVCQEKRKDIEELYNAKGTVYSVSPCMVLNIEDQPNLNNYLEK